MSSRRSDHALQPAHVRVPGSTSNLGAGFDCVGLALDRFLDVTFEPADHDLVVLREGPNTELPGEDLLERSFRTAVQARGLATAGRIEVRSTIPLSRGLGSSAAALVAGTALADLASGKPIDPDAAFAAAAAVEGHGDNAAPSAYGGLLAVVVIDDVPRALRQELSPNLGFAFAAPPTFVATRDARAALPATVPHPIAISGISRLAALLRGLATGDPDLLCVGFDDQLHVPYRLPLIAGGVQALAAARDAGAWGVTVSGSGSGILAVGPPDRAHDLAEAMRQALARHHHDGAIEAYPVRPVRDGVHAGGSLR